MKEELLKGLTEGQIAKLAKCQSNEEVLEVAKEEGIDLTNEQLEAAYDSCGYNRNVRCPICNSYNTERKESASFDTDVRFHCKSCDYSWYRDIRKGLRYYGRDAVKGLN